MRSSSSSSSSSLSSLAEMDPPGYVSGLGLNLKPPVPLPPAVDNGVAFPSMEKTEPSIPIGLSPAHSTDSLRSCIKETRPTNSHSNGAPSPTSPILEESPTTRKRRSVSFAVEEAVVYHLRNSTNGGGSDSESGSGTVDVPTPATEDDKVSSIPFPSLEDTVTVTRPRRMSGIFPDRFIGMDTAGSLYTYIRSNALSTFSSRTSLSSDSWGTYSEDGNRANGDASWMRMLIETTVGLSLALGWLAVGRVVGTIEPGPSRQRIQNEHDSDNDPNPSNRIEM